MNIRTLQAEDLAELVELCQEHALFEGADYETEDKAELLAQHLLHQESPIACIVVEHQKQLIGYASFMRQFSTWDAAYYLYLDCLYLKAAYRGQGLGHQVMDYLKNYAIQQQCDHIQWQTPNNNLNAIQFYQKLGASSKSKERFFWNLKN